MMKFSILYILLVLVSIATSHEAHEHTERVKEAGYVPFTCTSQQQANNLGMLSLSLSTHVYIYVYVYIYMYHILY